MGVSGNRHQLPATPLAIVSVSSNGSSAIGGLVGNCYDFCLHSDGHRADGVDSSAACEHADQSGSGQQPPWHRKDEFSELKQPTEYSGIYRQL